MRNTRLTNQGVLPGNTMNCDLKPLPVNRGNYYYCKMKRMIFMAVLLSAAASYSVSGQPDDENFTRALNNITQSVLQAQMSFLASDWTEGREAGQKGEYIAGDYIASMLKLYGVKPGGDHIRPSRPSDKRVNERSYFQNFTLVKYTPAGGDLFRVTSGGGDASVTISFSEQTDFGILPGKSSIEIEAPVVFVGYGFQDGRLGADDFKKLDLKGKMLLKVAGLPGFAARQLSPAELSRASGRIDSIARRAGALGIIEFNPKADVLPDYRQPEVLNTSPAENRPGGSRPWIRYALPSESETDGFARVIVSSKTAGELLRETGIDPDEFIKESESKYVYRSGLLKNKSVYLQSNILRERVRVRNIIGIIEGKDPDEILVLGGHYDHMGIYGGYIWNGADDNASGTVGIMTLAKAIVETGKKPEKTIVIALWTAEESGLLGSEYYVRNLPYPLKNVRMNLNLDMIARYFSEKEPDRVLMDYTVSQPLFRSVAEKNIRRYGIGIDVQYLPAQNLPGGSDHRSFIDAGIPAMRFRTAHSETYHKPNDEYSTIDWDIMEKIVRAAFATVWELANSK